MSSERERFRLARRLLEAKRGEDLREALGDLSRLELEATADGIASVIGDLPHDAQRRVLAYVADRLGLEQLAQVIRNGAQ